MTISTLPAGLTFDDGTVVRGPAPRPAILPAPRVHTLAETYPGGAYGETQCSDDIRDGDVLVIPGIGVGVMVSAWPTMAKGDADAVGFHTLAEGADVRALGADWWGRDFGGAFFMDYMAPKGGADYSASFALAFATAL